MAMSSNLAIKIPDSHYVGFQKRESDQVPLGFMTPEGTDKAAQKRKATVDGWANGGGYYTNKQATLTSKTFDNKPMVGFKMGKNISYGRGWDSRHDKWRIEDPRGFQLEITSGNLQEIMTDCTIERGEILEECIWGRLGSENILIPVSSETYKRATENTKRMATSASIKDLKPGFYFTMKNGDRCWFAGRVYAQGLQAEIREDNDHYHYGREFNNPSVVNPSDKSLFAYVVVGDKTIDETFAKGHSMVYLRSSLTISNIEIGTEISNREGCEIVNKRIHKRGSGMIDFSNKWGYRHTGFILTQVTEKLEPNLNFKFDLRKYADYSDLITQCPQGSGHYETQALFVDPTNPNKAYRINYHTNWKSYYKTPFGVSNHAKSNLVDAVEVDFDKLINDHQVAPIYVRSPHSYYMSRRWEPKQEKFDATVLTSIPLYKVFITYTDSTGFDHEVEVTYG